MRCAEILPSLFKEIEAGLTQQGRTDLAQRLNELSIVRWTYDPSVEAIYLYLSEARPLNAAEQKIIGSRHSTSIDVDAREGMVVIDIDNLDRLSGVEILNRPDVRIQLESVGLECERLG